MSEHSMEKFTGVDQLEDARKPSLDLEDKVADMPSDIRVAHSKSKEEKRLVLKQDLLILPLLSGAIFFGYLDRSQIGNARVMGMQKDLGLTNQQFYNCLMMFFLGYMVIELPAGLLLRVWHPRYVIGCAAVGFGVFACCIAASKSYASVMVLRVLIGLAEAFVTNAFLYASQWYRPDELALRVAAIYGMSPVAGAISGVIAYGVEKNLENVLGYQAWQWLFIIEGVVTIGFGLIVVAFLPGMPDSVAEKGSFFFRHERERRLMVQRTVASQNTAHARPSLHQILLAFRDPKLYLGSLIIGAQGVGIGAFTIFLPTFVKDFGFSTLTTQLYTMIPYGFGLVTLVGFSFLADHLNRKAWINFTCLCITITGFIVLMATTNKVALVAGCCFVAAGAYPGLVVSVAWILALHGGFTKRAMAVWFFQIFVQCYSIIATQVYNSPPRFLKGHGVALGLYVLAGASTVALWFICSRANEARDQRKREFEERGEVDVKMQESFEDLGDFHPAYRYSL